MPSLKKKPLQSIKGMHDILPLDQGLWERVRRQIKEEADFYNFSRIDTPLLEQSELFEITSGLTSDIVEKQMYVFRSGEDRLALRPEGTAPVARAYVEHGLEHLGEPLRLYYIGPMFRHEQPQAGRYREHHQAGFEILGGEADPIFDAQAILVCFRLIENLKISPLTVQINTIGCNICRPIYRRRLSEYYRRQEICADCKRRLAQNPLRLLDCKKAGCQPAKRGAPVILDSICPACSAHFKQVLEYLNELCFPYFLNQQLFRGLDYYNRTVFEIVRGNPEEEVGLALASGGRYDYLIKLLGGKPAPGVGGAVGLERLVETIKAQNITFPSRTKPKIFLIHIGDLAKKKSFGLIETLRKNNLEVIGSFGKESLQSQLRLADKEGAVMVLIFGQRESLEESIIIRDLRTGAQETVLLKDLVDEIKKRL